MMGVVQNRMVVTPRSLSWVGLPLLALAVLGCGGPSSAAKDDDKTDAASAVEVAPVTVRPMQVAIHAQGTFVASQGSTMKVGAIAAGRIANVFVKEGDAVKEGQFVAGFESRAQAAQPQSAAAALSVAQVQAKESALNAKAAE